MTPQLYTLSKQFQRFLAKHHAVLFFSFIGLIIAAAIYLMYQVVQTTFSPLAVASSTISGFDQTTIDKIKNLHNSTNNNVTIQLPSPRPNPFTE